MSPLSTCDYSSTLRRPPVSEACACTPATPLRLHCTLHGFLNSFLCLRLAFLGACPELALFLSSSARDESKDRFPAGLPLKIFCGEIWQASQNPLDLVADEIVAAPMILYASRQERTPARRAAAEQEKPSVQTVLDALPSPNHLPPFGLSTWPGMRRPHLCWLPRMLERSAQRRVWSHSLPLQSLPFSKSQVLSTGPLELSLTCYFPMAQLDH